MWVNLMFFCVFFANISLFVNYEIAIILPVLQRQQFKKTLFMLYFCNFCLDTNLRAKYETQTFAKEFRTYSKYTATLQSSNIRETILAFVPITHALSSLCDNTIDKTDEQLADGIGNQY